MKVILSDKAYFKTKDKGFIDHFFKQTNYQIYKNQSPYPVVYQNSGRVTDDMYWIPVTRMDIFSYLKTPVQVIDKRIQIPVSIPVPKFTLRDDQTPIVDSFVSGSGVGIINGKPGFGKTITALAIAQRLGQKTLIICTNVGIRTQWEKEVKKWFGFDAGVIGSGKFNIEPAIVVGNIQTISKHYLKLVKAFGTVIVDEVHHCVASTFTSFLERCHARYRIGLSGTLKRKDGLNVMFKDYFGFEVYSPAVSNTVPPTIHKYRIPVEISGNNIIPWATRANEVYDSSEYRDLLIELVYLYYRAGHKVLVVSDRTHIIDFISEFMYELDVPVYSIKGVTSLGDREVILDAVAKNGPCVLIAAQSIFSEGISLDELSCLILASIINNESLIEQLAGRIQRIREGKLDPVLVDIGLEGGTGWNQARGRMSTYNNNGWDIVDMTAGNFDKFRKNLFAEDQ